MHPTCVGHCKRFHFIGLHTFVRVSRDRRAQWSPCSLQEARSRKRELKGDAMFIIFARESRPKIHAWPVGHREQMWPIADARLLTLRPSTIFKENLIVNNSWWIIGSDVIYQGAESPNDSRRIFAFFFISHAKSFSRRSKIGGRNGMHRRWARWIKVGLGLWIIAYPEGTIRPRHKDKFLYLRGRWNELFFGWLYVGVARERELGKEESPWRQGEIDYSAILAISLSYRGS